MLENFFVYHRNGECLCHTADGERKLTPEYITGLRAASSTLFSFVSRCNADEDGRGGRPGAPGPRLDPTLAALKPPIPEANTVPSSEEGHETPKESILNDGISELSVSDMTFQFLDLGVYMLIAQAARFTPKSCLSRTIVAVRDTMRFHLGTFDNVSQDSTLFESISDIIRYVLDVRSELVSLTTGIPLIPISSRTQST